MADLVDTVEHPPRPTLATGARQDEDHPPLHWTTKASLGLLVVFLLALPLAGFLGPSVGLSAGLGFLGLAAAALTTSYLLGTA
jgi:hypothetical protein